MRVRFPAALASAAALAASLTALGAQAQDQAAQNPNASVYENAGWTFEQFDADGDGTLSKAEIYGTLFGAIDTDDNDQISNVEFVHFMDDNTLRPSGWDVDNDGVVTQAEFQRMQSDPTGAEDNRQGVPSQAMTGGDAGAPAGPESQGGAD